MKKLHMLVAGRGSGAQLSAWHNHMGGGDGEQFNARHGTARSHAVAEGKPSASCAPVAGCPPPLTSASSCATNVSASA